MNTSVPADFPGSLSPGSVSGAHPKLLARKVGDRYVLGLTAKELLERYEMCQDLIQQLVPYCARKQQENSQWSHEEVLLRVRVGIRNKGWALSDDEVAWVLSKVRLDLGWEL